MVSDISTTLALIGGGNMGSAMLAGLLGGESPPYTSDRILVVFGRVGVGQTAHCIHGGGAIVWPLIQDCCFMGDLSQQTFVHGSLRDVSHDLGREG